MKIKVLLIFLILIPLTVFALTAKKTELLGIPTADVLQNGQLDVACYFSTAIMFGDDRVPLSYNLAVSYGLLNTMDITLHMYTYKDFALQYQYNLLKGHETFPDIALGVKNLTYRQYVDEGGGGSDPRTAGYYDYSWEERSSDLFSIYAVFTEDFGAAGKYTIGIGRGEFVGYDRGKYLSTAAFLNETQLLDGMTNEFVFGFFGGAEIPIMENLAFLADVDGRDVNVGLKYFTDILSVSAALTHAELFTSNDPDQRPRIDVSFNYLFDFGQQEKKEYGFLSINIIDNATNKLIPATVSFEGKTTKPFYLKSGKVKMKLKPGKYTIKIEAKGYKWQKRILTIAANATNEINIALSKKYDEKQKQHDKAITLAKEAKTKLNQGDLKGALIKLEEAKKLAPNDPTVLAYWKEAQNKKKQMISTHKNNALMYEKKGWWKSAKNEWNAILVLDKNNSEAKNKYSAMDKKIKGTEKPKVKPVEKPKGDPEKLYNEGYEAFLDGNYKKAVDKFEQVLKINPNHAKAKQYLGKAKKRL